MNLNKFTPVNFQANLKTIQRDLVVDVLGISSDAILVTIDFFEEHGDKLSVTLSGDFPLNLEVHFSTWLNSTGLEHRSRRLAVFRFNHMKKDQLETLRRMLDYYEGLRKAGVRWAQIPELTAKAA